MSRSLPHRPNIDQLRRQARELRDAAQAGEPAALNRYATHVSTSAATLSSAQLVIAREHGFPSWARLKASIGAAATPDLPTLVDAFLVASIEGRVRQAARLLRANPAIAAFDISTAAVLGDQPTVQGYVQDEPALAILPDTRRNWPPLLYATHSAWHTVDRDHAEGILQVVWLLLDTGANPDTDDGRGHTALFGAAGAANNAAVASLLLRYGANPNDGESLYHAALHADRACLRVLLGHGATVRGTNAFAAAIAPDNAEGVRLMIESGGDPGRPLPGGAVKDGHLADRSLSPLPLAVATCGVDVVEPLLAAGADPNTLGTDHRSVLRTAVRAGNQDVVRLLRRYQAHDDSTEVDNFLGACLRADRTAVDQLLSIAPGLPRRLTTEDLGALADAAEYAHPSAVRMMLDLGFPIDARRADGATALHAAAYAGRSTIVALLLSRGADVRAPDGQWGSSALAWATVGSGERPRYARDADWIGTVRTLLAAGSPVGDAWIGGKPPSEEVAAFLVEHGVDEPDEDD
jgi:ankyrin repeat protein